MDTIPYPAKVDLSRFEGPGSGEALYGLPETVLFCKKCVISNQRPNSTIEFKNIPGSTKSTIAFDQDGICDACHFAAKKAS
jgi:hypothetical protein